MRTPVLILAIICFSGPAQAVAQSSALTDTSGEIRLLSAARNVSAESVTADAGQITGNTITCVFNSIVYVGEGGCVAGSDIGAQINAAYASLPPEGGEIAVLPQSSGNCYVDTTQIYFGTP